MFSVNWGIADPTDGDETLFISKLGNSDVTVATRQLRKTKRSKIFASYVQQNMCKNTVQYAHF